MLFKVPRNFKREFMCGVAFPNALAAPVIMMETLCRQQPLVDEVYVCRLRCSCRVVYQRYTCCEGFVVAPQR